MAGDSADNINFTGRTFLGVVVSYDNLRLGAAVDSVYSGIITPGANGYLFGGGGAKLTVSSVLADINAVATNLTVGNFTAGTRPVSDQRLDGRVVLSGANTYTGTTTVKSGILEIATAGAPTTTSITVEGPGTLVASGAYTGVAAWVASNKLTTASAGSLALTGDTAETITMALYPTLLLGAVSPSALNTLSASFTPGPSGYRFGGGGSTLTVNTVLTGANALNVGAAGSLGTVVLAGFNDYTGATTVNAGNVLRLAHPSALGTAAGATTVSAGATLDLNGQTISEPLTIVGLGVDGQGAIINSSTTVAANVTGVLTQLGNSFTVGGAGDINLDRVLGNATFYLTKNGAGTLTLGGTLNNGSLGVNVNAGTLVLALQSALGLHAFGNNATVNTGATMRLAGSGNDQIYANAFIYLDGGNLDMGGKNEAFGGPISTSAHIVGSVYNNTADTTSVISIGDNNSTNQFRGTFVDNTNSSTGKLVLRKIGTGTYSITGASTYTGTSSFTNALSQTFTGSTVIEGGTLQLGYGATVGTVVGDVAIAAGATLAVNSIYDVTLANKIVGEGNVQQAGMGVLTLTGANTYTGQTIVNGGTIRLLADATAATSALGANTGELVVTAGTFDLNGFNLTRGRISGVTTAGVIVNSAATASVITVGQGRIGTDTDTFAADIQEGVSGTIRLVKTGAGVLVLQGMNRFTGGTKVESGTLRLGSTAAFGRGYEVEIVSGATYDVNGTSLAAANQGANYVNLTIAGTGVGGFGAVTNSSATAPNAFAGIGNLTLSADASIGGTGGRFDVGYVHGLGYHGTVNGNGFTLTKVGTGIVNIRANGTNVAYNVAAGELTFENIDGTATNGITVQNAAILSSFGDVITLGAPLTLKAGSTLRNNGAGTQTWSGNVLLDGAAATQVTFNTTTPANNVPNGITLTGVVSGTADLVKTGANFSANGAINGVASRGVPAFLRLAGVNTYTGNTIITTGTVQANSDRSFGATLSGAVNNSIQLNGGTLSAFQSFTTDPNRGITLTVASSLSAEPGVVFTIASPIVGGFGLSRFASETPVGMVVLAANNTFASYTVNTANNNTGNSGPASYGGITKVTHNGGLGSGNVAITAGSGTLQNQVQLEGGVTIANGFTTSGRGQDGAAVPTYGLIASLSGNNTITGTITMAGGGGGTDMGAFAGSTLTLAGIITANQTATRYLSLYGAGNFVLAATNYFTEGSSLPAGLNVGSADTLSTGTTTILSTANDYSGRTVVQNGALLNVAQFANVNTASSIGKGSTAGANSDLSMDGGTLQYTGANAQSTDRLFSVGNQGGVIDASGSLSAASLKFTGAGAMGFFGYNNTGGTYAAETGIRTLTLTGSNAGDNTVNLIIGDNTGATSILKTGTGRWILGGVNTYTGTTTVSAGTLETSATGVIAAAGTVNALAGTTFRNAGAVNATTVIDGATVINAGSFGGDITLNSGTFTNNAGATIAQISLGKTIKVAGGAFTNAGTVSTNTLLESGSVANSGTMAGRLTMTGGTATSSGTLTDLRLLGGSVTSSGAITKAILTAGTLTHTGAATAAIGTVDVNTGAIFENAGTLGSGTLNVASGATYRGAGSATAGTVNLATGGILSPGGRLGTIGFNNLNLASGAIIELEASDPGSLSKRDGLVVNSALTLGASPVSVKLFSFNEALAGRGAASVFNPNLAYSWSFLKDNTTAGAGLLANKFTLDAAGWQGAIGSWSLATEVDAITTFNNLKLVYTPTNPLVLIDVATDSLASAISAISLANVPVNSGLNKSGAGILTIDLLYAYTGGTNVTGGGVKLVDGGALGTGSLTLDTGTLLVVQKVDGAIVNNVGGSGDLLKDNVGTSTLTGSVGFTNLTVTAGTLAATNALSVATATTIADGATLNTAGATALSLGAASVDGSLLNAPAVSAASLTMGANGIFTTQAGKALTVTGAVLSSGSLTVGSLTAGGNLTAAGTLASAGAINAAAIAFGTGTFTATNLVASGAFTNAGTTTLTGSLTATSVTQSAGSLSTATLSTTGAFALQAGTATITGSGSLASTSITLGDNTTLTAPVINNSGLITLGTGAVLNLNHNRDITLAAPISGTGSLTVSTSNVITLSGTFGLPAVNVSGNTLALKGVVSTASDFTKSGTGLLILSAVNTYTGATFINGGTLRINSDGALGAAATAVTVAAGGTLDLSGSVVANNINLAGRTVTIAGTGVGNAGAIVNNSNFTQNNAIQSLVLSADASIGGTQGWNVGGFGTLELAGFTLTKTGSNTIAIDVPSVTEGNLTVAQGKLSILGGTQVLAGTTLPGVVTVQSGATLELGGSVSAFGFTRAVNLLTGSTLATAPSAAISTGSAITVAGAVTLNIGANGSFNPAVAITGTADLTKTGYGRLILAALVDNDITGNLTITEGNVQVADSLGLPSGTITLTAQPGADANRRTRLELGNGVTVANNVVINGHAAGSLVGTGVIMLISDTDIATVSGSITFNAGVTSGGNYLAGVSDAGTVSTGYLALTGDLIAGTAQPAVRKGTILLNPTGTGSSYSLFDMREGTLRLGKNNAILSTAEVKLGVHGAALVDLNGFSQDFIQVTKSTNAATITNANTTTMGVANFTNTVETTYAGTLANGAGGLGLVRLNKTGTGNLILTGANTHNGGTYLTTGTLELRGTTILAANTIVDVAAGTTLKITSANADLTMAANITGTGTVRIDSNISGAAGSRSVTLSGDNRGFTGTYIMEPSPSGISTPNAERINVTNGNTFGTANVIIKDRAQVWMQGGTYANNFTITGWGFGDSQANGGTPALGLNLTSYAAAAQGGIGAFRFNGGEILTGTVTLDGDAKIMAWGATAYLNGSVATTNATDRLIIGGGGNSTTIVLGGTNNVGANALRDIWVNVGGGAQSAQLTIGGGTAAGTLGTGKVTLYTDATLTGVAVLNIRRTDGYTMEAGQLVEAVAPVGLSTNMSKAEFRANTTGTGLTLNGAQIILSNLTNAGGSFRVATEVDGAIVTIDAGSLLKVNQIQIAEGTNLGGTVNQTGGTVQQFASTGMRVGHWGGRVSTYNLSGGSIEMVNPAPGSAPNGGAEQAGGIYVGIDGVGVFNQTGGSIKTPWMVLDNRGANAAIDGVVSKYSLSAGTLEFTAGTGLISNNLLTGTAAWSGGTMRNSAPSANVAINTNIVVTGTTAALDTVDATRGFVFNREVTGGGTVTTSGGGTVFVTTAATQTFDLVMAGTSGLTKQGTGTTTLIGNQTYSGPTLVSTGTLSLAGNIPNSDLTVSAGANLQGLGTAKSITFGNFTSFSADPSASSILAATNAFSVAAGGLVTVNLLSGPATSAPFAILNYGSTTATGANFALSGAGSYRNPPTFNVGATSTTLALGFGELVWTNGGANANWDAASDNFLNIGTSLADKFIFGDIVTFDDSLGVSQGVNFVGNIRPTTTVVNNSTYDYTLTSSAGNTLGGYGQVIKRGTGVLNMAGVANTFTGGTLLSAGRINVGAAGSLGTGRITLGATDTAANNVSLYISGARPTGNLTNAILVSSNGTGVAKIGSDVSVTGTGGMGFSGITLQRDLIIDSNAADRTDYAGITGTGNVTFIGTGRSILGLGLANTFTGNMTLAGTGIVQVGTVTGGTPNGIPDNATLTINAGSTFVMSVGAEIIGGLSGAGNITTNQNAGTLTVGTGNATSTFTGVIADTTGFALGLNKVGTGTLTLAGANTFTGAVQVGTLVAPGGTLELTGANAFGALTVFTGTVNVSASQNNLGSITLNNGAFLDVLAAGNLFNSAYNNAATVTVNAGATWRMVNLAYGPSGQLSDYAARRVLNGGTMIVTGDTQDVGNNFTVNVTTGGTFRYAPTNVGQTLSFIGNANSDIALNGPLALQVVGGSLAINENIVGAGSITKTGNGKLTLGGVNTFTGNLVISEGEFNVNGAYALGRGTVSLPAGVTLDNTSGADVNVATATTITLGDGVLNFTGTNSLSLGYGTIALPANTTVNVAAKTLSLDGPVTGAFGITKTGAGTLALHAPSNTFTGGVTVNAGLLSIGKYVTGSAGTGAVVFNGGGIAFDDYQALRTFDLAGSSLGSAVPDTTVISANFSSLHNKTGDIVPLNTTRGFVGKLYLPAGTWNFQESFDDGVALKVNNSVILNNLAAATNTTGSFTATTAGWYDIDLRVYQGAGAVGAYSLPYGVGIANGAGAYVPFTTEGLASLGVIATVGTTPGFSYAGDISLLQNGSISSTNLGNYDFTLSGVISGPADLTKLGAGTIVLTGANIYTGKTIIQEGTLALTGSANATTGIEVNGGNLRLDSATAIPTGGVILNGGGLKFNLGATTAITVNNLTINAAATIDTTGLDVTFGGPLTGTGSLVKAGTGTTPGTLTLANGSTFAGTTTIAGGKLVIANDSALGAVPATATAGQLTFTGGSLQTTANVTLAANRGIALDVNSTGLFLPDAATTLTVDSIIASGTGTGTTSGKLALGSATSGAIILNGVNTYAGDTDLLGGIVTLGNDTALGAGVNLNLPAGVTAATLQFAGTATGTLTKVVNVLDTLATLTIAGGTKDITLSSGLTGAGTLVQTGAGKLILGGTSLFAGFITADNTIVLNTATAIAGGNTGASLRFGSSPSYAGAGTIVYGTGVTTDVSNLLGSGAMPALTVDTGTNNVTWGAALFGQFEFTKKGSGELILEGLDPFGAGNVKIAAGTLTMAKSSSLTGVMNGAVFGVPSSLTFTGDATLKYATGVTTDVSLSLVSAAGKTGTIDIGANNVTFASALNGAGNFEKIGTGTLTLAATNAFTGGFKLTQGTLEIAGVDTLDASTGLAFTGNTTLKFATGNTDDVSNGLTVAATKTGTIDTNGNDVTFANAIGGTGSLIKAGAGTLTLDAATTLTGALNVNAGTLALTAFGGLSTPSSITVGTGAALDTTAATGFTLASGQVLMGAGTVNVGSTKTLTIATGSTLNATGLSVTGKLALAGTYAATLGAPGTALAPNAAAQINVTGNVTLGGTLSLTSNGAGAGAYQIINGSGTTTGSFTAFNLAGINNALLHQEVVTTAGVTGVNLVRVATTTGTLPTTVNYAATRPVAAAFSTSLNFANTATADGFSEALTGTVSANGTGFTTAAAGATGVVTLGLDSLTAGAKSGSSIVTVSSVGVGTFANTSLVTGTVALAGSVYDYATATLADATLAFGNVHVGATGVTRNVSVTNTKVTDAAYQDNLSATATAVTGLSVNTLSALAADTSGNLVFTAATGTAGSLAGAVTFTLNSTNTVSGLDAKSLTTTANVTTTGQVYSGLSTWNATTGSWGRLVSGFGTNWGTNQGSPGLDAAFANVDTATFDNTVLANNTTGTVSLDGAAPSLKAITFNTTGGGYTLDAGSGGALTLASGLGNAAVTATAGNHTIATDLTLSTATDAAVDTGAKLTLSGAVSGTVGLAKSGAGTLTLAGNNAGYTGAVTLAAGTLEINSFNAIINASALNVTGNSTLVYGMGITTDVSAKLGTIAAGTTLTVDTNGNILTYASTITSAGTLVKGNSGTLILGAANSLSGALNVTGGSVRLTNAGALGTATVTVGAGSILDLNTLNATGAAIVLDGGTLSRTSAYTGTVTFTNPTLDSGLLSLAGTNTKVGVLTGQTAAINGETRDVELNGGTLTGLSSFTGTLIVKSTLDASATISGGAVTLAGGTINLQGQNSMKSLGYLAGQLTNANNYTGNVEILGAVSVATGTLGNGVIQVGSGDTVTLANNGLNNAIALSGGTVDFNGKTATTSIAYTNGTLTNAAGYTGDVTLAVAGSTTLTAGSLGSARVIAPTGTTLDFAAGFNNAVRNTGGAVTNGSNYTGTMAYAAGQSINVTADQVAKLAFESGTTAKGSGTLTSLGFAAGSAYTMTMKDGAGVAGVGFDSVTITGALNLATLSSTNRMTLNLFSVDSSNVVGGNIANQTFAWNDPKNFTLFTYGTLTLGNGVTNVADLFTVNYANFKDKYGVSAQADWFIISNDSVNGAIVLTAIPEPSTYGMSLAGLALALAAIRRRNKRKTDAAK